MRKVWLVCQRKIESLVKPRQNSWAKTKEEKVREVTGREKTTGQVTAGKANASVS